VIKPGSHIRLGGSKPVTITIDKPYAIGRYEVTFAEWDACVAAKGCSTTPSDKNWGRGKRAVMNIVSSDVQQYLAWLSTTTGRRFRLPTTAEWEHAALAGVPGEHTYSDLYDQEPCLIGNGPDGTLLREGKLFQSSRYKCQDGFGSGPAPVGSFKPNAWGLYDVNGNVWELVNACGDTGILEQLRNESCKGKYYIARGGAWDGSEADYGAGRTTSVSAASDKVGFRVAVDVE